MADRVRLTPEEIAEKQNRNLKASIPDMVRGIEKVTVSPTAKAAEKLDKMKANWNKRMDDGTIARRLKAVPLEAWKDKILTKGVPRIAAGIDAAKEKTVDYFTQLVAHQNSYLPKIAKMPDLTLEDSIARMTANTRAMSSFRKK